MCELKVVAGGEVVMEDVVSISVEDSGVRLTSLLGETRYVQGRLTQVDMTSHTATIEISKG